MMRPVAVKQNLTSPTTSTSFTHPGWTHLNHNHDAQPGQLPPTGIATQRRQQLPRSATKHRETTLTSKPCNGFNHNFSTIPLHPFTRPTIQPKLTISTPGDRYEREADSNAEQVMRMPAPEVKSAGAMKNQPSQGWDSTSTTDLQRQAMPYHHAATPGTNAKTSIAGLGAGIPLPQATRQFFEPRFGYDLNNVRLHTDSNAARSAAAIQAKAYTHQNNIVFGAGEYQPATRGGQHLLAHELSHVIQQNTAIPNPVVQRLASPNCSSASAIPFADSCPSFYNTCYSGSFTGSKGTYINVSVMVDYANSATCSFPEGYEDFRVQLYQCGWMDTQVQNFGVANIGTFLNGSAFLPGAGFLLGNDNYYLRVYSRSRCELESLITVT